MAERIMASRRLFSATMEGLGVAANIATTLDLSTRIASSCLQHSKEVKNPKHDIAKLRRHVLDIQHAAEAIHVLLGRPSSRGLMVQEPAKDATGAAQLERRE